MEINKDELNSMIKQAVQEDRKNNDPLKKVKNIVQSKTMLFNAVPLAGIMTYWDEIQPMLQSTDNTLIKYAIGAYFIGGIVLRYFTNKDLRK